MHAITVTTQLQMDEADAAVRQALAGEGFGVLTEIDVASTLRAKLGVEREPLKILGACNPEIAYQALQVDPSVALLLPCNVVIAQTPQGTTVSAVDPRQLLTDPRLASLADDGAARLERALQAIGSPASAE